MYRMVVLGTENSGLKKVRLESTVRYTRDSVVCHYWGNLSAR